MSIHGSEDQAMAGQAVWEALHHVAEAQERMMEIIGTQAGAGLQTYSISNAEHQGQGLPEKDFPVPGGERWMIQRSAIGGEVALPASPVVTQILNANNRRLGGAVVNRGAKPLILVLGPAGGGFGAGQLWLAPEGGSWDFRLGTIIWCGDVSGAGEGGATSALFTEV